MTFPIRQRQKQPTGGVVGRQTEGGLFVHCAVVGCTDVLEAVIDVAGVKQTTVERHARCLTDDPSFSHIAQAAWGRRTPSIRLCV